MVGNFVSTRLVFFWNFSNVFFNFFSSTLNEIAERKQYSWEVHMFWEYVVSVPLTGSDNFAFTSKRFQLLCNGLLVIVQENVKYVWLYSLKSWKLISGMKIHYSSFFFSLMKWTLKITRLEVFWRYIYLSVSLQTKRLNQTHWT